MAIFENSLKLFIINILTKRSIYVILVNVPLNLSSPYFSRSSNLKVQNIFLNPIFLWKKVLRHYISATVQRILFVTFFPQIGIATVDSSVSGLGGCPYAKGATGNVATEDVVYMLNGLGVKTNVDLGKLILAGEFISNHLGRPSGSRAAIALRKVTCTSKL